MIQESHPNLPKRIAGLREIAYNLWWSWHPEARSLFKLVDRTLWRETNHNPVRLLKSCNPERLNALSKDPAFLQAYDAVLRDLSNYMKADGTWYKGLGAGDTRPIAYFSAEFGVHNSLPIYSGGLGVLAGDHCKTASDLGLPFTGVGFMYPQGYVHQQVGVDGWQQNIYDYIDWDAAPVQPALTPEGQRYVLKVSLGGWPLNIAVFRVVVGRVCLYLMDTNVEGNTPGDREVSGRLYGGDITMRLRQEIVLGIGGVRVLRALKIPAEVFHANEGHSAFMFLERVRELVADGKSFEAAVSAVRETTVFTTHTPVGAGHDVFPEHLIEEYFKNYWPSLGLDRERFLELGRVPGVPGWNMTALALKLAGRSNGVSRRHGEVSRQMWKSLWPRESVEKVPIRSITNGVHLATWVNQDLASIFKKYLGPDWKVRQDDPALWSKVDDIPDEEFWRTHLQHKQDLLNMVRDRVRARWMRDRMDPSQVLAGGSLLDANALTIGFARRFAGYKRATMILSDPERLKRILLDPWRPVQLVFAGKAHPADDGGKMLIQHIYHLARDPAFGGRIAFVEDYDMHIARYFVQGSDVWLNNPMPPLEACGTSGEKAAVNGVLNLSVLDGWWEEGYTPENGWAISEGQTQSDDRDRLDAESLYTLLEEKVVPLYYDRGSNDIPLGWVRMMKESIRSIAPQFSAARMVKEYTKNMYLAQDPVTAGSK
ncbi:MAG: alpha-glucan family phosphorylase [Elusimicrobia bacterium]|nr:alpha-glucan family phosphorylase [Elusimicrobiota bacterium]